ncbi:MAG: aldo/keto reductase, partial [Acidimicrobiales bacterium]
MDTRRIGSLEVSVVGLGCNNFGGRIDEQATREVVAAALDRGITFFDTADIYGGTRSEELLGRALGAARGDVVVATKFGMSAAGLAGGASADYVRSAVEASLRRLGTDRIDLYQLHAPDRSTPIADTLGALGELVAQGKVREVGCSNFDADQLREAQSVSEEVPGAGRFVSVQNHYSIVHREPEAAVLAACAELGLAFVPFYPLERGLLTGKYRRGQPPPPGSRLAKMSPEQVGDALSDPSLATVGQLESLAADHGRSLTDLAFAWLLRHQAVASVIAG